MKAQLPSLTTYNDYYSNSYFPFFYNDIVDCTPSRNIEKKNPDLLQSDIPKQVAFSNIESQKCANIYSLCKVQTRGLPLESSITQIKNYFRQFGEVKKVTIKYGKKKQGLRVSKGLGFITFKSSDSALKAVQFENHLFYGAKLECKLVLPTIDLHEANSQEGLKSLDLEKALEVQSPVSQADLPKEENLKSAEYSDPLALNLIHDMYFLFYPNEVDNSVNNIKQQIATSIASEDSNYGPILKRTRCMKFSPV